MRLKGLTSKPSAELWNTERQLCVKFLSREAVRYMQQMQKARLIIRESRKRLSKLAIAVATACKLGSHSQCKKNQTTDGHPILHARACLRSLTSEITTESLVLLD